MAGRPLKKIKKVIREHEWELRLLSDITYIKLYGEECEAITNPQTRRIDFKQSSFSIPIVRHELLHVLVDSCHVSSSNLTAIQMEELCAMIVQSDIYLLLSLSEQLFMELGV